MAGTVPSQHGRADDDAVDVAGADAHVVAERKRREAAASAAANSLSLVEPFPRSAIEAAATAAEELRQRRETMEALPPPSDGTSKEGEYAKISAGATQRTAKSVAEALDFRVDLRSRFKRAFAIDGSTTEFRDDAISVDLEGERRLNARELREHDWGFERPYARVLHAGVRESASPLFFIPTCPHAPNEPIVLSRRYWRPHHRSFAIYRPGFPTRRGCTPPAAIYLCCLCASPHAAAGASARCFAFGRATKRVRDPCTVSFVPLATPSQTFALPSMSAACLPAHSPATSPHVRTRRCITALIQLDLYGHVRHCELVRSLIPPVTYLNFDEVRYRTLTPMQACVRSVGINSVRYSYSLYMPHPILLCSGRLNARR